MQRRAQTEAGSEDGDFVNVQKDFEDDDLSSEGDSETNSDDEWYAKEIEHLKRCLREVESSLLFSPKNMHMKKQIFI